MTATEDMDLSKKVRINIWVIPKQHQDLKAISSIEGRSVSDILRQLIGDYLRKNRDYIDQSE